MGKMTYSLSFGGFSGCKEFMDDQNIPQFLKDAVRREKDGVNALYQKKMEEEWKNYVKLMNRYVEFGWFTIGDIIMGKPKPFPFRVWGFQNVRINPVNGQLLQLFGATFECTRIERKIHPFNVMKVSGEFDKKEEAEAFLKNFDDIVGKYKKTSPSADMIKQMFEAQYDPNKFKTINLEYEVHI